MYVLHFTKLRYFTGEPVDEAKSDFYASYDIVNGYHIGATFRSIIMFNTIEEAKKTLSNFKRDFTYFDFDDNPMFSDKVDIYKVNFIKEEVINFPE